MGLFDTAEARLADLESRVATLEGATPVDPPPEPTILTQQMFPVSGTTYLNGALDFANTPITVQYPELVTGSNAVSKSSVDFTLKVDYRRRFE